MSDNKTSKSAQQLVNDNKKQFEEDYNTDSGCISGYISPSGEIQDQEPKTKDNNHKDSKINEAEGKTRQLQVDDNTDSGLIEDQIQEEEEIQPKVEIKLQLTATSKSAPIVQFYVPEALMKGYKKPPPPNFDPQIYYAQNEDGDTKLHIAVIHGLDKIIPTLIAMAPETSYLNIRNYSGQTALHMAVIMGYSVIARRLINAGADVNIRDGRCNSALHLACLNNDLECALAILTAIYPQESSHKTPKSIAKLEEWNMDGETCFYLACKLRYVNIMRELEKFGANVNAREGKSGLTALHYAIEQGDKEVMIFLCENCKSTKRFDIDTENYAGLTSYQLAQIMNRKEMVKYLGDKGAEKLTAPDSDDDYDDNDMEKENDYKLVNDFTKIVAVN